MMKLQKTRKPNQDIRDLLSAHGIKHWELAIRLGVHEQTLCHWLRVELPADVKQEIIRIVKEWQ